MSMRSVAVGIAAVMMLAPSLAWAVMSCSIGSVSGVAFGTYDIFSGSPLDSAGTITYRCDGVEGAETIVIQLDKGASGTYSPRTLIQGAYELNYNLYLDASRTTVWGDGTGASGEYGPVVPADGTDTDVSVYGRIPAGQNAHVGSYSDTVVVTLIF